MISAQQGIEFTTNADDPVKYCNIKKVYSIWLCTETAQKRANSIEKYEIGRSFLVGSNTDTPRYDILNAILINISGKHDTGGTDNELIRMMTDLFDERLDGIEKIEKLEEYGIELTQEIDEEVTMMCSYATAMENKGMEKGMEKGLKALVISLKEYISEFDALYSAVKKNEEYAGVSREEVLKYYK